MPRTSRQLALITPAKNEAANIPRIVAAIAEQSVRPDLWILVDDQSEDGSGELFQTESSRYPCFGTDCKAVVVRTSGLAKEYALGTKYSSVVRFGMDELERIEASEGIRHEKVGLLDCDVFPLRDYYAILCAALDGDARLGLVSGGRQIEIDSEPHRVVRVPKTHAAGMMRVWRRDCLDQTGYYPSVSQDAVSEARAIMMGWRSRSIQDAAVEMRKMGGNVNYRYYGRSAHIRWVSPPNIWLHAIKLAAMGKRQESREFLDGYYTARRGKEARIQDPLVKRFYRYRLFYRLLGK